MPGGQNPTILGVYAHSCPGLDRAGRWPRHSLPHADPNSTGSLHPSLRTCRVSVQKETDQGAPAPTVSFWSQHTLLPLLAHGWDKSHGPSPMVRGAGVMDLQRAGTASVQILQTAFLHPPCMESTRLVPSSTASSSGQGSPGMESSYCLVAPLTPEPHELKQCVIYPLHTLKMQESDNKSKVPSGAHQEHWAASSQGQEGSLCEPCPWGPHSAFWGCPSIFPVSSSWLHLEWLLSVLGPLPVCPPGGWRPQSHLIPFQTVTGRGVATHTRCAWL